MAPIGIYFNLWFPFHVLRAPLRATQALTPANCSLQCNLGTTLISSNLQLVLGYHHLSTLKRQHEQKNAALFYARSMLPSPPLLFSPTPKDWGPTTRVSDSFTCSFFTWIALHLLLVSITFAG